VRVYTHLPAYEDGTDRVFRNVGIYNSEAGESPKRKRTIIRIFLLFCEKCIVKYWCNKNQEDTLFTFKLFDD